MARTCPMCAEEISPQVNICPYCQHDLNTDSSQPFVATGPSHASKSSSSLTTIIIVVALGFGLVVFGGCVVAMVLPAIQQAREAARRTACSNNLRQIGLALHNYHTLYDSFPPAYVEDENGNPMYSWRVLILPMIEQQHLYEQFDLSKPWDDPANLMVLQNMPSVFRCPSSMEENSEFTSYAAVTGENCIFEGAEGTRISDVRNGMSNTLMVGEVIRSDIPWTAPMDINVDNTPNLGDYDGFASYHIGGVQFLFGDGSVQYIHESATETVEPMYRKGDLPPAGLQKW